jgi:hypothetical protein
MTTEDRADTEFGPQIDAQAWSVSEPARGPVAPYADRHSWATTARRAGLVLGGLVAAAGAVLALTASHADTPDTGWPTGYTSPPTPQAAPLPPFTMPPDVPVQHVTQDGEYLTSVRRATPSARQGHTADQ